MQKDGSFNLGDIARFTGLSYRTIRRLRKDGTLPRPVLERGDRRHWNPKTIRKWWRTYEANRGQGVGSDQ